MPAPNKNPRSRCALVVSAAAVLMAPAAWGLAQTAAPLQPPLASSRILQRVVKVFDFDEQKLGNFEPTPMGWQPCVAVGYPGFQRAVLDPQVGHAAPPSMRLSVSIGSAAAELRTRDIPVHPSGDYLITGFIRVERMRHARARLEAFFLDHALRPLEDSRRSSAELCSNGEPTWQPIRIIMPASRSGARWIGLRAAIEQPDVRAVAIEPTSGIRTEDTHATAWFDDIRITRLPRLSLRLEPDDVLVESRDAAVLATVDDLDAGDVAVQLDLLDETGRIIRTARGVGPTPIRMMVHDLPIGAFRAVASAGIDGTTIATTERSFLRVAGDTPQPGGANFVGLRVGPVAGDSSAEMKRLVDWLRPGSLLLSFARERTIGKDSAGPQSGLDAWLRRERQRGALVAAVLDDDQLARLGATAASTETLTAALARDPVGINDGLSALLIERADVVSVWQLAANRPPAELDVAQHAAALSTIASVLARQAATARLAAAWPAALEWPEHALPADIVTAGIPHHWPVERVERHVQALVRATDREVWAELEPSSGEATDAARAELIQRIVAARQGGATRVHVSAPWRLGADAGAITPDASAVALRTLAGLIGGLAPRGRVDVGPGVRAYLFADRVDRDGVLVLWTEDAFGEPRGLDAPISADSRTLDLYGQRLDGVPIAGWSPRYVTAVDVASLQMRDIVQFDGPTLEAGAESCRQVVHVRNPSDDALDVTLRLFAPRDWKLSPKRISLRVPPRQTGSAEVSFRLPRYALAGEQPVRWELDIAGPRTRNLSGEASVRVGLEGIDDRVYWQPLDGGILIQQRVTNRTPHPVDLRAGIRSPAHPRETRTIVGLEPGRSVVREYRLPDLTSLAGEAVRVTLARMEGPEIANQVIEIGTSAASGTNGSAGEGAIRVAASRR